ncbi:probable malonyl-CoA-acyl carrier protein transacylase, mitochondrial isoform X2 [Vanessa cardui]|uniref:probable malonyl-CoA-acyl carrier protein transacylase, mitochondrial isoform X2 n=1 Tax=Vanessa cardui TaxID=171605 RepID=UPI001F13F72D|nr:probable malonyl-CoA-acyl carrier protein transacylase, mitochondrial isoform X2 [Vanessa cardui]
MKSLLSRVIYYTGQRSLKRSVNSKAGNINENETPLRRLLQDASAFAEVGAATPAEGELEWATQPYTVNSKKETTSYIDPKDTTILLFPGQGSQHVGMGRRLLEVPAAKDLYELAASIVGWDVGRVCREGPEDELQRRCQTAVMVTSLGALELARETRPGAVERVRAVAGFSLGEISALVFAGSLPFEQALRLVELRAAAMEAAARERSGGMLTVWLTPDATLARLLAAARQHAVSSDLPDPVCQIANYLFPGCKVLAGDEAMPKSGRSEDGARHYNHSQIEKRPMKHKTSMRRHCGSWRRRGAHSACGAARACAWRARSTRRS